MYSEMFVCDVIIKPLFFFLFWLAYNETGDEAADTVRDGRTTSSTDGIIVA